MTEAVEVRIVTGADQNLRVNTVALLVSSVATGLLGLAFWSVVARLVPADEVGVAAAWINSALMLSTLALVGIDTLFERFLPVAGTGAGRLVARGHLIVAGTALLAGTGMVVLGPRDALFGSGGAMAAFPLVVLVLALFALQDKVCSGAGVARWAAAKNLGHAVAKLAALAALVGSAFAGTIVAAWTCTAAVAVALTGAALRRRVTVDPQFLAPPDLPSARRMWAYLGPSFGISALWTIGPLVVPLIVITTLGAAANAYFAVTWSMVSAAYLLLHLVVSPYVAEVAGHPDRTASLTRRMVRMQTAVAVVVSAGLVTVGPLVLGLAGPDYRANGQDLLFLAAAFLPLAAVNDVYEAFARIRQRLLPFLVVRVAVTAVIVGGSLLLTRSRGLDGVGWAFLAAEAMATVVLVAPTVARYRAMVAEPGDASDEIAPRTGG